MTSGQGKSNENHEFCLAQRKKKNEDFRDIPPNVRRILS